MGSGYQWVLDIKSQVEEHERLLAKEREARKEHSIYKLPEAFLSDERRRRAYKPQVVSLGPYHHNDKDDDLQAMEEHKARALRHFLVRTNKSICDYLDALRGEERAVVKELMVAYKDLGEEWKDDEERFLRLMIFDGCFLRELFRGADQLPPGEGGYEGNDPIFSNHGFLCIMPRIARDMLMIENQIPLLVLKKLLAVEKGIVGQKQEQSLDQQVNKMVLSFFGLNLKGDDDAVLGLHVLDAVRKGMIGMIVPNVSQEYSSSNEVIWPATRLRRAGIKFMKSTSESLVDVNFGIEWHNLVRKGTLRLPQILVDDCTESKFLNLVAFEHLHVGAGNEVSSYVAFMDNIIDSEKDVILLTESNIIKNFLGTAQAVAELFNGLSHDVSIEPVSRLRKVHLDVTEYCKTPLNYHLADLRHSHFNTPWSVMAFTAASIALLITIIQFVYMFLGYYRHHS